MAPLSRESLAREQTPRKFEPGMRASVNALDKLFRVTAERIWSEWKGKLARAPKTLDLQKFQLGLGIVEPFQELIRPNNLAWRLSQNVAPCDAM
jgi:hypothetical protein